MVAVACSLVREPYGALFVILCEFAAWGMSVWVLHLDELDRGRRTGVARRVILVVFMFLMTLVVSVLAFGFLLAGVMKLFGLS